MAAKKNPFDALQEVGDHFDQIKGMNPQLTESQILETVAKATGQTIANIRKRWRIITSFDWPVLDWLERGIIGMNRASMLAETNMSVKERTEVMDRSLADNITDSKFKEWLARHLEKNA